MKKLEFVATDDTPDFVVYDFAAPERTEIAPGVHLLFAFLDVGQSIPRFAPQDMNGAMICTYEPGKLPPPPHESSTKEEMIPVSIRCNSASQIPEKRERFLQLAFVERISADVPISSKYKLLDRAATKSQPRPPIAGAWLGGSPKWLADPLELNGTFLFQLSLDVLNKDIHKMKQMMDVASLLGFTFATKADGYGPCGFCISQG